MFRNFSVEMVVLFLKTVVTLLRNDWIIAISSRVAIDDVFRIEVYVGYKRRNVIALLSLNTFRFPIPRVGCDK
jgi:hypothetical protein